MEDYSIKSIRKEFKEKGIFYTPKDLAEYMKSFIDIENYKNAYDPTCGRGNLLEVFGDEIEKYGQEINQDEFIIAQNKLINFKGYLGDTIKNPAFMDMKFDVIIANPPFSIKWEENKEDIRFKDVPCIPPSSKADYVFILHCLYLLSQNGIAIIMNFPGVLYRGAKEGKIRQWLIENNYIDTVVEIEGKKFVDTDISTCLLILRKNKKSSDIKFIDKEQEEKLVSYEEIKENNFRLTVSSYIQKTIPQEQIDEIQLERDCRANFLNKTMKFSIEMSILISQINPRIEEELPIRDFINDIKRTAEEIYEKGIKSYKLNFEKSPAKLK